MPAAGENKQMAVAQRQIEQRRIAVIKPRQHARAGQSGWVQRAMFPEMDFGEITEARFVEWRQQGVLEIHLAEQRVFLHARLTQRYGPGFCQRG